MLPPAFMPLSPGNRLGPYEILAPLGAGGMGEVYRARDSKLDREVAIKVLPDLLTASPDALARFEREAKSVAALSHPNILAIFDFGTHDGVSYAVMELLEGETLRGKLDGSTVSQRQAIDWSLQIARGLSAAHGRGVIHRDLKPDNVFVTTDGHVKILDFGLAKRADARHEAQTSAPTDAGRTETGTVMGTMGYMSPEQLRGLPVDHRTDLFSFGAVLYELLSGQKAFKRHTASDTIAAILKEEPPELTLSGRNVSPALDHVVRHCLEKDRESRFQTAKDVAFALSEASSPTTGATSGVHVVPADRNRKTFAIVGVLALVLAAATGLYLWKRPGPTGPASSASGVRRVAVLPFENLGAAEDDYFADGIADAIRGKLAGVRGIEVIARGSSTPYKKTTKSPQEIARELNAQYLLTATVRWQKGAAGSRVQVSPELVEIRASEAPATKWQQPFDAALTDVFQVQGDIASRVVQSLGVALIDTQQKKLAEAPTASVAAYDAYLRGEKASEGMALADPPSLRHALAAYVEAAALDPTFTDAWARASLCRALLWSNSVPTPELASAALETAEKAIATGPQNANGYVALGTYYRVVAGDPARALEEFQKGEKLAPGTADPLRSIGRAEVQLGQWENAIAHFEQAEKLDPRNAINVGNTVQPLLYLHRCGEAREAIDRTLALSPSNLHRLTLKLNTFLCEGNVTGAREIVAEAIRKVGAARAVAWFSGGQEWLFDAEQLALLRRLTPTAFDDDDATWAYCLAFGSRAAHDEAAMLDYAERSRKANEIQLKDEPDNANLRSSISAMLALLGQKDAAIREARRACELVPVDKDHFSGTSLVANLALVYTLVGEQEKAIDTLEGLVRGPGYLTAAWLKVDPTYESLRGNPRFQKLVRGQP